MSTAEQPGTPSNAVTASERNAILRIYAVVLAVGMCCGLAIVSIYELTKPIIAKNRIAMRQSAILEVVPGATTSVGYAYDASTGTFEPSQTDAAVFAGYDDAGELVGLAIETMGMGYADNIRVLYGYDPRAETVIGLKVLESRETPGLGDRIEKDETFVSNFDALDVAVRGDALANPIEFVKPGAKTQAWQIDGITGATISSKATAMMLRESTSRWMPKIQNRQADFGSVGEGATNAGGGSSEKDETTWIGGASDGQNESALGAETAPAPPPFHRILERTTAAWSVREASILPQRRGFSPLAPPPGSGPGICRDGLESPEVS